MNCFQRCGYSWHSQERPSLSDANYHSDFRQDVVRASADGLIAYHPTRGSTAAGRSFIRVRAALMQKRHNGEGDAASLGTFFSRREPEVMSLLA